MRKIEIPPDTPTEFQLGDKAGDMQTIQEREQREVEEAASEGGNFTVNRGSG